MTALRFSLPAVRLASLDEFLEQHGSHRLKFGDGIELEHLDDREVVALVELDVWVVVVDRVADVTSQRLVSGEVAGDRVLQGRWATRRFRRSASELSAVHDRLISNRSMGWDFAASAPLGLPLVALERACDLIASPRPSDVTGELLHQRVA
jgi:hypothetical protein